MLPLLVWAAGRWALRRRVAGMVCRLRRDSLRGAWEKLEPSARQLAQASGLQAAPGLDDWLWANSVFWCAATPCCGPG